jgi:pimeloyl-ACP methyl ester carboxylesterase
MCDKNAAVRVPSTDGVTVALHDLGGDGPPLLVSHATGFCGRVYEPLAAALVNRFHVWALDFRGHGESTAPAPEALHWHRVTDDLAAAVATIGDGPIAVFGHSMGGACALLLEHRAPGTFTWAYVFEPIVRPDAALFATSNPMAEQAARRRTTFPSRADVLWRYAERPPLSMLRADCLRAYVEHGFRDEEGGAVTLRCAPAVESGVFARSGDITLDDVDGVTIPVTVAFGAIEASAGFSPATLAGDVAARVENGRLERFDALGHLGPMQDPELVAASVLDFASSV